MKYYDSRIKIKLSKFKIPAIIVGSLVLIYVIGIIVFNYIFFYRCTVNGIDVSFKNVQYTKTLILNSLGNEEIKIIPLKSNSQNIKGKEIDVSISQLKQVDNAFKKQNPLIWPISFFDNSNKDIDLEIKLNKTKLTSILNRMSFMDESKMEPPINAKIVYNKNKEEFIIQKEILGTTINKDVIYNNVYNAIKKGKTVINLYKYDCYIKPEINKNNDQLISSKNNFNQVCNKTLIYKKGTYEKRVYPDIMVNWLDTNSEKSFDTSKIKEWVLSYAEEINTVGKLRKFKSIDGNEYEVKGGTFGFKLDVAKEVNSIVEFLNSDKKKEERQPNFISEGIEISNAGNPDWGNTYAEVNLTTQHMFYIKDGTKIFEADIVSGLPTAKKETPCGVFDCLEKKENKVLRGEVGADGVPEYETPVAYWMRITWTGVGFHTATWQPSFGGNRYTYAGSHGCVNMSYNDSKTLYGIIDVHTPIIIHK